MAGVGGDQRRPRRKGVARSAHCGAPRLPFVDGDEADDVDGDEGHGGEANGVRWPRGRARHGGDRVVEVEERGSGENPEGMGDRGEQGSEWGAGERTKASGSYPLAAMPAR